jgi:hypothetical protein
MSPTNKRLIQVTPMDNTAKSGYQITNINFSFVSGPEHQRKQLISSLTCREEVNRTVHDFANGTKDGNFDFSKLRLLIVYDPGNVDSFKRNLFNGKAALNVLENVNGWNPSKITTVKHPMYNNAWLLTGPAEWLSQPQLLSMATWIIRLAATNGPLNTEGFDQLEGSLHAKLPRGGGHNSDISTYLVEFWDKIYIILKYYKEIFGDIDHKKAWIDVEHDSFGSLSGLLTFVRSKAGYSKNVTAAQKRFVDLCREHLPRENKFIKGEK